MSKILIAISDYSSDNEPILLDYYNQEEWEKFFEDLYKDSYLITMKLPISLLGDIPYKPGIWVWEGEICHESLTLSGDWRRASSEEIVHWNEKMLAQNDSYSLRNSLNSLKINCS